MKVKDIGVCMRRDILESKKRDGDRKQGIYCSWTLSQMPTPAKNRIGKGSKLWVVTQGRWCGYFVVLDVVGKELRFWSESWRYQDMGPRAWFRQFTYKVPVNAPAEDEE